MLWRWLCSAIGAMAVGILVFAAAKPPAAAAPLSASASAKSSWTEKTVGTIPKTWGDLVGVSVENLQTVLVFKDVKGTLRRVTWSANGSVNRLVHALERP